MKKLEALVLVIAALFAGSCGGAIEREDARSDDSGSLIYGDVAFVLDVGALPWNLCPAAWPPAPPVIYCGDVGGAHCYEVDLNGNVPPCKYPSGEAIVLRPGDGGSCSACAAMRP